MNYVYVKKIYCRYELLLLLSLSSDNLSCLNFINLIWVKIFFLRKKRKKRKFGEWVIIEGLYVYTRYTCLKTITKSFDK